MFDIGIVILAAGTSSRMGKVKQLLPYKDTTLVGWAIEQAKKTNVEKIACVLGDSAKEIAKSIRNSGVQTIHNRNFKEGMSTSISCGTKHFLNTEAILVMLADQPGVTSDYLNQIIDTGRKNPLKIVASGYGEKAGVPALFPKKYFSDLLELKGDKGAKDFLNTNSQHVLTMHAQDRLVDIDTLKDYQNLEQ